MTEEVSYSLPAISVGSAAILGLPGIAVGVGILSSAIDDTCPPQEQLVAGYIFSSLNLVAGAFILGFYIDHYEKMDVDWVMIVGIGQIAIGASGIGFTIWAHTQPDRPEQTITLAPMIMPDIKGNPALGIGLQIID